MFNGQKMKELREAANLTLAELGEKVGKTKQMVSLIEKGYEPTLALSKMIANELGKPLDELLK